MAVRFNRKGTTNITDHNDLLNKGTRTHAQIDTYLAEIDAARVGYASLDNRLDAIESKNTAQDTRITATETKNTAQDTRLTNIETKNTAQDTAISSINSTLTSYGLRLNTAETNIVAHATKISDLEDDIADHETRLGDQETVVLEHEDRLDDIEPRLEDVEAFEERIDSVETIAEEVIAARTDKFGILYSSLKERLDTTQGQGGSGGGGGGGFSSNYLLEPIEIATDGEQIVTITKGTYELASGELEVFLGGFKQRLNLDYTEVDGTTIRFFQPLFAGDLVVVRVRDRAGNILPLSVSSEHIITTSENTFFSTSLSFQGAGKKLEVYVNGQLYVEPHDYLIPMDKQIVFTTPIPAGSLIVFEVVDKNPDFIASLEEVFLGDGTTQIFKLNTFDYLVDKDELEVYVGGLKYKSSLDFIEVDSNTVEFLVPPPKNVEVRLSKENGRKIPDLETLKARVVELETLLASTKPPKRLVFTAVGGENEITLPEIGYAETVDFFVDGMLKAPGIHFNEVINVDGKVERINLLSPLISSEIIVIKWVTV